MIAQSRAVFAEFADCAEREDLALMPLLSSRAISRGKVHE
jgi:hypothetical protein